MSSLRVLLVTPYSPLVEHWHAAQDIAAPMVAELAGRLDLHVYAGDGHVDGVWQVGGHDVTFHAAAGPSNLSRRHRFSTFPYRVRSDWQPLHAKEVSDLVRSLRPAVVHAEYLHPASAIRGIKGVPRSGTLHDIEELVAAQEVSRATNAMRATLGRYDHRVISRWERRYIACLDQVFVFSDRDAEHAGRFNGQVSRVQLGIRIPERMWHPADERTLLFAGAMWRGANVATAEFLARRVMPMVWETHSDARLKLVGAGSQETLSHLSVPGRVDVVGEVPNLDDEYAKATVNLAPSIAPAGVLLKAIRSMAVGCPVVLNSNSADAFDGVRSAENCMVADSPEDMARSIASLLQDPHLRRKIASAGRELVRNQFDWTKLGDAYVSAFERIAQAGGRAC